MNIPTQPKIHSLIDMQRAATEMDIMYRLGKALAGEGNLVAFSLKKAIDDQQPVKLIIQTIKDMIRDAPEGMSFMLGSTLCTKILSV